MEVINNKLKKRNVVSSVSYNSVCTVLQKKYLSSTPRTIDRLHSYYTIHGEGTFACLLRVVSYTFDFRSREEPYGPEEGGTGLNSDGDADTLLTPDDGASYCTVLFCFPYYLLLLLPKKELITMKKKKEDCHNFIYFVLCVVPCCYCIC